MKMSKKMLLLYVVVILCLPVLLMGTKGIVNNASTVNAEDANVIIAGRTVSSLSPTLDFNKCKITDYEAFVRELGQFPCLTRVELCGSNLSNEQMEGLQNVYPNIKFVWTLNLGNYWTVRTDQVAFSTNKGKGPDLTNADVEQLKYCTDMVALDIGHNAVSDVSFLRYMPKLRILILVDNRVSDITPITACKDLVYLETFVNRITDITPLTNLVNLIDVNISYNRFTDITPILNKPRLERLFVTHCGLSQIQLEQLKAEYPQAQIEYTVTQSIDAGWRLNPRYKAMRTMYKTNTVSDLFMTDTDRILYYKDVFNYEYYVTNYPEVVAMVGNDPLKLLYYYLDTGVSQGQQASEEFSVVAYKVYNPELVEVYGDDYSKYFMHYMCCGYKEGRITVGSVKRTSKEFSETFFCSEQGLFRKEVLNFTQEKYI